MADTNIGYHRFLPNPLGGGTGGCVMIVAPGNGSLVVKGKSTPLSPKDLKDFIDSGKTVYYEESDTFRPLAYLTQTSAIFYNYEFTSEGYTEPFILEPNT